VTRLAFVAQGGTITWDGTREVHPSQVQRLQEIFASEAVSAASVGAGAHYRAASRLQRELTEAAYQAARWKRASRPASPSGD
jgi:hypothetical protein